MLTKPVEPDSEVAVVTTPDQDPVETARQLLISHGYNVLDQTAMTRRLEAERRKFAPLQQTLEQVQAEAEAAKARLAKIDDAGKSSDQIWTERQAEWQRRDQENQNRLAARD
jgi:Skp family chaperone for outer membrane proteins